MKVEILLTKRKAHQNQNFKVLVTKPVAESEQNLGLALATRRHFCNYAIYISIRYRSAHKYEPPRLTKGFRASGHFTEELGLFGGLTSLSALWNRKSLTQEMRFKWHASGSLSLNSTSR